MNWRAEIRNEFSRLGKRGDDDVVEELAQHAAAAWEAARADGALPAHADAAIRELIRSWCNGTAGPARTRRATARSRAGVGHAPLRHRSRYSPRAALASSSARIFRRFNSHDRAGDRCHQHHL